MPRKIPFVNYVQKVLKDELSREDKFLEESDIHKLLEENGAEEPRAGIEGYPSYPLYRELGNMLQIWLENRRCPALDLPRYDLLDEKIYAESRVATFSSITPILEGLDSLWQMWSEEEIKFRVRDIMLRLGKRGLLDLLGIRKTVGTIEIWPPPRETIEKCFKEKHSPNSSSQLSVGARALAKHHHRDESTSWWGTCTGTEVAKNEHAEKLMKIILDSATWINTHWLPQDIYVIEARHPDGYGLRWTADGSSFRGFLEPQMEGGHEIGWRH